MSSDDRTPVYTPFLRRFTDERARDIAETRSLYFSVREQFLTSVYAGEDAHRNAVLYIAREIPHDVSYECAIAIYHILDLEVIFGFPDVSLDRLSMKEQVDLNRYLRSKQYFLNNDDRVLPLLFDMLIGMFTAIQLPKTETPSPFVIPLAFALPEPKKLLDKLYRTLWHQQYVDAGLFVELSRQLYFNLCRASGISDPENPKKSFLFPSKNDAPLSEITTTYLTNTPLLDLFETPVPLQLTHEIRFSHMHIVGGSGAGKTQLLQNLILHDLTHEKPALVIVDSQGDLIHKISHLEIADRLILISPKDIHHPPALNIFDVKRLGEYDEAKREQVTAGVIETFDYLFAGLLGADLTAKQGVFFRFVARLMLALPTTLGRNATILDMINLMDDASPYQDAINTLPPIQKQFFERDFKSKTFVQTKEQIRYRLQAILENPTLARLFTSQETKIDLFTELNNGSVILVDTAKDFLKGASGHFGRIFISLVLQAALERAVIPEKDRAPAFLIVDEAAAYFDQNIDDLLTEARKYKLGCIFAHQFLEQCTPSLRASLAANTSIKMAGGVSTSDARAMAAEMRTTHDFILSQPKLHFACHIRNVTPQAVSIPINVGELERQPQLSHEQYDLLIASNRERVSTPRLIHQSEPPKETPKSTPDPGTQTSTEW